jgi:hypothetical protein
MIFKCEISGRKFEAAPQPYPNSKLQTRQFNSGGDEQIVCPCCKRAYIYHERLRVWVQGRPLSVIATNPVMEVAAV